MSGIDSNPSLNTSIDIHSSIVGGGDLTNSTVNIGVTDFQAQGKWGIPTTDAYQLALQFYHKGTTLPAYIIKLSLSLSMSFVSLNFSPSIIDPCQKRYNTRNIP